MKKEFVNQVIRYNHSPVLIIQRGDSDFEAEKNVSGSLKCLAQIEN